MAKASTAKQKTAPASVKVPKTRLNKTMKELLLTHMEKQFDSRIDDTELRATFEKLLQATNAILRAKYPEEDMQTLRKYNLALVDTCLRFNRNETGRLFYLRFGGQPNIDKRLADVPCRGGCHNNDVFPVDEDFEKLADTWEKMVEARVKRVSDKRIEYRGFLEACRYLEEVEAVVPLSDEIRKQIGAQSRSLAVINPEIISRIKSDFAAAA
jgi:hypothetical protein